MCLGILCALVPFRRRKRRGGKPDSFLTLFEREMVPMLLKELHSTNPRFYEVVCYRWYKESLTISEVIDEKKPSFEKEGLALRSLVNKFAKCLLEKGTFDEDCEQRLIHFRQKKLQCHIFSNKSNQNNRKKSFSEFGIEKNSAERQSILKALRTDSSNLKVPDLKVPRRRCSSKSSTSTISATAADCIFLLMGEILIRQFQCTIHMDEGNVDERELEVIVWKHFVEILVALLIDKERFP